MKEETRNDSLYSVDKLFNRIAGRYDFLNHFLSFGIDKLWRKKLLKLINRENPQSVVDIATGTGDMLVLLHKSGVKNIHGIDPSNLMLQQAKKKINKRQISKKIKLHTGYAENLPFSNDTFDVASIVFGLRNFENAEASLSEIRRILHPARLKSMERQGYSIFILEFDMPQKKLIRYLYLFYLNRIIPFFGKLFSGDKTAYTYLAKSIQNFSENTDVNVLLKQSGFSDVNSIPLLYGIARIYTGKK